MLWLWALVNDRVKLLAYRVLDPTKAPLLAKKSLDLTPQITTPGLMKSTSGESGARARQTKTGSRPDERLAMLQSPNETNVGHTAGIDRRNLYDNQTYK